MGMVLAGLGIAVMFCAWVLLVINAFRSSVLWGLGSLLVPLVQLVYVALNWEENAKPFLAYVGGLVIAIVGALAAAPSAQQVAGG